MHKDVMSDPADDVSETILYSGKDGTFIITIETIFQATSKSSGGGMSHTSGYEESRLTTYDFGTGAILSRVEFEENADAACEILGIADGKIWFYSVDPELGLHSRNPKTLDVVDKESQISAFKGKSMARPEYTQIDTYYGFDFSTDQIMVSDLQGIRYFFDPIKKTLTETDEEIVREDWHMTFLSTLGYFSVDSFLSFDGKGDRQKLQWCSDATTAEIAFTKPEVFIDLNQRRIEEKRRRHKDKLQSVCDGIKLRLDSLGASTEQTPRDYTSYSQMTNEERSRQEIIMNLQRDYRNAVDEVKREETWPKEFNDYSLGGDENLALIYSASNVSDTATAIITLVEWNGKKFDQRWQFPLTGFYHSPDQAEGAGVFEEGNPEFGYRWTDMHDGKFVMIAQLKMICIDMKIGKKIWEISL